MVYDFKSHSISGTVGNKSRNRWKRKSLGDLISIGRFRKVSTAVGATAGLFLIGSLLHYGSQNIFRIHQNIENRNISQLEIKESISSNLKDLQIPIVPKVKTELETKSQTSLEDRIYGLDMVERFHKKNIISTEALEHFKNNDSGHVVKSFENDEISKSALYTKLRADPYMDTFKEIESIYQNIEEYKAVIGTESDFDKSAVSKKDAIGLAQLTLEENGGLEGIFFTRKLDKELITNILDKEKVDNFHYENIDLWNLDNSILDEVGLDTKALESYGLSQERLSQVVLPRYWAMSHAGFDDLKKEDVYDAEKNLWIGAAHYFSGKLEVSALRCMDGGMKTKIEDGGKVSYRHYYFKYSRRSFLEENPNLAAFGDVERYAGTVYSCGLKGTKDSYVAALQNGHYTAFVHVPGETKGHRERIEQYKQNFSELEENGFLGWPDCL